MDTDLRVFRDCRIDWKGVEEGIGYGDVSQFLFW